MDDVFDPEETISSLVFFVCAFFTFALLKFIFKYWCCSPRRRILASGHLERPRSWDAQEEEFLQSSSEYEQMRYTLAQDWQRSHPPDTQEYVFSDYEQMQLNDRAVAAYEFKPLTIDGVAISDRTSIEMNSASDDGRCVSLLAQTNMPLQTQRSCYYFEVKVYEIDQSSRVVVGLSTKPYPPNRLPGYNLYSVGYLSNGTCRVNMPFKPEEFGWQWQRGDVIGVGYRPHSGTIFFTHNGRKLDQVADRWRIPLFPTIGCEGKCKLYVNLGQDGYVYIPANVNNWRLAPVQGVQQPPPAYGIRDDSVLLDFTSRTGQTVPPYTYQDSTSMDYVHTPEGSPKDHTFEPYTDNPNGSASASGNANDNTTNVSTDDNTDPTNANTTNNTDPSPPTNSDNVPYTD